MSKLRTIAVVLLLVAADAPLTEPEQKARDFAFEGVRIGQTETDLKKGRTFTVMPAAAVDTTGTLTALKIESETAMIFAHLHRGRVVRLRVAWDEAATARAGGEGNILRQLTAKFGKQHVANQEKKVAAVGWSFPRVGRDIELHSDESDDMTYVRLTITDRPAWTAAKKEQTSKTKTGLE